MKKYQSGTLCNQCIQQNNLSYQISYKCSIYSEIRKSPRGIQQNKTAMRWQCVIPYTSEAIKSTLITEEIDNLLLAKELLAQSQQQKHYNKW